jgi:ketosteroid isomerase-like protein
MSEANVEIVRRLYAAMVTADSAAYEPLTHPDGEFISDPRIGVEPLHGRDEIVAFFADQREMFDSLEVEVERTWELGEQVLCFVHVFGRSRAAGVPFDIRIAHLWTVQDGLVVRGQAFANRDDALAATGVTE